MLIKRFRRCAHVMSMDGRYAGFAGAKTGHGLVVLFRCFVFVFLSGAALAAFGRPHIYPVFAVGRKHTMETCQIDSGLRHQRRPASNEIQRLKDHMSERRPVVPSRYGVLS